MIAENGNTVKIHYIGTYDDGTVFDSSQGKDPLEFILGNGQVIQGFEEAVFGMKIKDSKKIHIPAAEAYGDYNEAMVFEFPRKEFPEGFELETGKPLQMRDKEGKFIMVSILEFNEEFVKLDGNHPMAGKDLNFEIELVEIS